MQSGADFFDKLNMVVEDKTARRVFELVAQRLGASGWELAKSSSASVKDVEDVLSKLTGAGILKSTSTGLDGNYALTSLGFALRERLVADSQSRY